MLVHPSEHTRHVLVAAHAENQSEVSVVSCDSTSTNPSSPGPEADHPVHLPPVPGPGGVEHQRGAAVALARVRLLVAAADLVSTRYSTT